MAENKNGVVFVRDDDSHNEVGHEDSDETELGLSLENLSLGPKKKLLVLSLNGLLLHRVNRANKLRVPKNRSPDATYGAYRVYKRPYCEEFMSFCLERFEVGIWSSAIERNVDAVLDAIMGGLREKLLFIWDQKECTDSGFKSLESKHKPLFFKDLNKVFQKFNKNNAANGFSSSNILFVDDEPYKALLNPDNTGIFPTSYDPEDMEDDLLDVEGELCLYLDGLANASDVQAYVEEHPFGQSKIGHTHPDWTFYSTVINNLSTEN